ncbi:MAG TPA: HAD family acid phosphatase [Bryobacteraceae bacterium]|nr:HAD family acid phosphatase [Bryobacteraceae bacterium]
MRAILCCAVAAAVLKAQGTENLNAVSWMQTAAEYQAVARQTYRSARISLDRALADPRWTAALEQSAELSSGFGDKAPIVILDLDETVLDNSALQARNVVKNRAFTEEGWNAWVAERRAQLVPGARDFLAYAHGRGVTPFYITNRQCNADSPDDPTVAVLKAHQLPFAPHRLLCRKETGDKSPRRARAAQLGRVLLMFGDDLNDFVTLPFRAEPRASFVADYATYWGERWFMLPNPTYGSWERTTGVGSQQKIKSLRQ